MVEYDLELETSAARYQVPPPLKVTGTKRVVDHIQIQTEPPKLQGLFQNNNLQSLILNHTIKDKQKWQHRPHPQMTMCQL